MGPLVAIAQVLEGPPDGLAAGFQLVHPLKMMAQQGGGPNRGAIVKLPWVGLDHRQDQFLRLLAFVWWPPRASPITDAVDDRLIPPPLETMGPVLDRRTAHALAFGHYLGLLAPVQV